MDDGTVETASAGTLTYTQYLRDVQYAAPDNLQARIRLHVKNATSPIKFPEWFFEQIDWSPARDVLDVGCGPGSMWTALPKPYEANLTLCDLSAGMITAAVTVASGRAARVGGVVGSVQALPFADESFDLVIANYMLYHATDIDLAISELRRVLTADGLLVAATNGPAHLIELLEIERAVLSRHANRNHREVFGSITGREHLERRFGSVQWRPFIDELHCRDAEDVYAYIRSTPPGDCATPEQQLALRREIDERMRVGNGVLRITKETGIFLARDDA
jgi:SAM-dependent methyltransferase